MNLNTQILIAAILGLAFGFLLTMYPDTAFVKHSLYGLGILSSVFIGLLKMLLVPLIFSSIVVGVSNLQAGGQLKLQFGKSHSCVVSPPPPFTLILGISCAHLFEVGRGVDISIFRHLCKAIKHQIV
ncbi:cation:dicarboxylase symporter family transporter [Acinetobacter baumannii]